MPEADRLRAQILDLEQRCRAFERGQVPGICGEVALAVSPATTTTVPAEYLCSSTSVVVLMPLDAGAAALGIPRVVPAKGAFVIHHAASASPRTYRFLIFTGVR